MKIDDEETFIQALLEGQPEPPKYFAMMKKLNKVGPKVLGSIPHPARLSVAKFKEALTSVSIPLPARLSVAKFKEALADNYQIVDTRDKLSFAGGHIPGSLNIQDNNSFSTWAGWMLDYEKPIILIARERRVDALNRALIRIGLDNLEGYVSDIDKLEAVGLNLEILNQISVDELSEDSTSYKIIDVRSYTEFDISHIPGAVNIHTGYLKNNIDKISDGEKLVLYCASGDRSAIGASYLLKLGHRNIYNLSGGINAWIQAGCKTERKNVNQLVTAEK